MGKKTSALGEPPAGFKPGRAVISEVLLRTTLGRRDGMGAVQAWDKPWGSLGEGCCRVGMVGTDRASRRPCLGSWALPFPLGCCRLGHLTSTPPPAPPHLPASPEAFWAAQFVKNIM